MINKRGFFVKKEVHPYVHFASHDNLFCGESIQFGSSEEHPGMYTDVLVKKCKKKTRKLQNTKLVGISLPNGIQKNPQNRDPKKCSTDKIEILSLKKETITENWSLNCCFISLPCAFQIRKKKRKQHTMSAII